MQTACLRDAISTCDGWLGRKQWFVVGDGIPGNPKTRWFSQTGAVVQKTTCWSKAAKGWRGVQTIESSAHLLDDTHKSVKCNKHKSRSAGIMDMWTLVKSPLHSGPNTANKKADASVLWFSLQFHTQIHTCQTVTLMFCVISQTLYFCSLGQHENLRADHGHPCVTRILFAKFALIVVIIYIRFVLYLFPKWTTKSTHVIVLHEHPQAVQTLSIHHSFSYVHIFITWKWLSPFSCKYSHDTLRIWLVCDMCEPNIFEAQPYMTDVFSQQMAMNIPLCHTCEQQIEGNWLIRTSVRWQLRWRWGGILC